MAKNSKLGIRGKALTIIQSLYSNVKSSVLLNGKLSDFFVNNIGVLQGEIISPLPFSLYVNDCEMDFISSGIAPIELQELPSFYLCMQMTWLFFQNLHLVYSFY